jgi:hypothetical protein
VQTARWRNRITIAGRATATAVYFRVAQIRGTGFGRAVTEGRNGLVELRDIEIFLTLAEELHFRAYGRTPPRVPGEGQSSIK